MPLRENDPPPLEDDEQWAKHISYSERAGTGENISERAGMAREILAILEE